MTKEELQKIIAIDEGFRIELTTSTGNMDKFQEAICASLRASYISRIMPMISSLGMDMSNFFTVAFDMLFQDQIFMYPS